MNLTEREQAPQLARCGGRVGAAGAQQGGFALILVLGALALMAFVAAQFSQRMDQMRSQAATFKEYAEGRRQAHSALQEAIVFVATQPGGPSGFGRSLQGLLRADGRFYELPSGAQVAVQDQRALLSLNVAPPVILGRLLVPLGATTMQRDTLLDTLDDYKDTDNLRRLNGAEEAEYRALGLIPPRNDWLQSVRELGRMPHWRDHPEWLEPLERWTSARRTGVLNPLLAPRPVLKAVFPLATQDQLSLFDTLKEANPFVSSAAAQAVSGFLFASDDFIFHTSDEQALIAWAPGLPKAYQIQLSLTPGGQKAPWQVSEAHTVAAPKRDAQVAPSLPRFPTQRDASPAP